MGAVTREDFRKDPPPERPRRPRELQDPLNHYLYHPLAWQLALRLARTPLTPNMVSVIGAGFVVAAAVIYAQLPGLPTWPISALIGLIALSVRRAISRRIAAPARVLSRR